MTANTRSNAASWACALFAAAVCCGPAGSLRAQAPGRGAPAPPRPDNPRSLMHIDAARALAGGDPWLQAPFTFYCVAGNAMPDRLARLRARKSGDPNPFVVATDRYVKFWSVVSECIQAEIARRGNE